MINITIGQSKTTQWVLNHLLRCQTASSSLALVLSLCRVLKLRPVYAKEFSLGYVAILDCQNSLLHFHKTALEKCICFSATSQTNISFNFNRNNLCLVLLHCKFLQFPSLHRQAASSRKESGFVRISHFLVLTVSINLLAVAKTDARILKMPLIRVYLNCYCHPSLITSQYN